MSRRSAPWILGALLIAALALGGKWLQHDRQIRLAWQRARPGTPDLNDWPEAFRQRIRQAETQMNRWPPDLAALGELSRLYLANGFLREAEVGLRALVMYEPQNAHWAHFLAGVLADTGRLEEAIPLWENVAQRAPDYLPAQLKLGEALLKTNRSAEAVKVFTDVLSRAPDNPYALLGLARVDLDAGRWAPARARLEKAIAADPLFSAGHSLLATVAAQLGDTAAATAARERATALGRFKEGPDPWGDELREACYDVYRLRVMAASVVSTGGGREALPVLERALQLAPENPQTHRQLGKLYSLLHDYATARAELEKAIALQPTEPAAYLELVNVYRTTNDLPAAFRLLQQGLEACPGAAGLHYELALALIADKRSEEALVPLRKARELDPDNLTAYQQLAVTNFKLGREADAVEALQAALDRNPSFGPILLMMARYQIQSGTAEAAEKCLARARHAGAPEANLEELAQTFYRQFGRAPQ